MISNGFNMTQYSALLPTANLHQVPTNGFLNMTQSMLPPIGQTTLGAFSPVQSQAATNPGAFATQANSTKTTSLLDSTQMQLQ